MSGTKSHTTNPQPVATDVDTVICALLGAQDATSEAASFVRAVSCMSDIGCDADMASLQIVIIEAMSRLAEAAEQIIVAKNALRPAFAEAEKVAA